VKLAWNSCGLMQSSGDWNFRPMTGSKLFSKSPQWFKS